MELRKIKKQTGISLMIISVILSTMMIVSIGSESYIASQGNFYNANIVSNQNSFDGFGFDFLISLFTISQIASVSAQVVDEELRCCPRAQTANGIAFSQDLTQTQIDNSECLDTPLSTSCSNSALHNPEGGTCIIDGGISCLQSSKFACDESSNIKWVAASPANAQINGQYVCRKAACIVGNDAIFTTGAQCRIEGGQFLPGVDTEAATILLNQNLLQGACVSGNSCSFTTGSDCNNRGGDFHNGFLCTNSDLKEQYDLTCEPTSETMIVKGKVYWKDTCGNPANIYDSAKTFSDNGDKGYWETVFPPNLIGENACNLYNEDGDLIPSRLESCGACDQFRGTLAMTATEAGLNPDFGEFACKDLSCIYTDTKGNDIKKTNGEKWCVYEGIVGNVSDEEFDAGLDSDNEKEFLFSADTVGSEHWLYKCENGELSKDTIEHSEFRDEVCQENVETGQASLVPNAAPACVSFNPLQTAEGDNVVENEEFMESCNSNPHCAIKEVNVDSYFKFKVCVPRFPTGLPIADVDEETSAAESYCALASTECTMIYRKKIIEAATFQDDETAWECIENCDCEKPEFGRQMNELCISLGDCGSYIDYAGGGNDNVEFGAKDGSKSGDKPEFKGTDEQGRETKEKDPQNYSYQNYLNPLDFSEWDDRIISPPQPEETEGEQGSIEFENPTIEDAPGDLLSDEDWNDLLTLNQNLFPHGFNADANTENLRNSLGIGSAIYISLVHYGIISGFTAPVYSGIPFTAPVTEIFSPYAGATLGAAIGVYAGASIAQQLDVTGPAATAHMVAGGVAGAALGYQWAATGGFTPGVAAAGWWFWGPLIVMAYLAAVGAGETEERKVSFTCLPYEPPTGTTSEDCGKCNENPLMECTQYRCEALGQTCELLNGGTDEAICASTTYDPNPPIISEGIIGDGYGFEPSPNGIKIVAETGLTDCVPEYEVLNFTLNTENNDGEGEYAECRWSYTTDDFELMENTMDGGAFKTNHNIRTEPLSWNLLDAFDITGNVVSGLQGDVELRVKCQDVHGNVNPTSYVVNFCMTQAEDNDVVDFNNLITTPKNNAFVPFGTNSTKVQILLKEPAECKYDTTDVPYDLMANTMTCDAPQSPTGKFGRWVCSTPANQDLQIKNDVETIYVKCSDKPWETPENRNVNEESFVYKLQKTKQELKVSQIALSLGGSQIPLSPGGFQEIKGGGSNFKIDLLASTTGGSQGGKAECRYDFVQSPLVYQGDLFFETFKTTHKQKALNLLDGNYNISVTCNDDLDEDGAGNTATLSGTFNLFVDSVTPIVVRAYHDGGKLELITDEEAKCAFGISANYCSDGSVDTGKSMTTGFSKVHQTVWEGGQTYYIKCKDLYNNENSGCSRTIIPNIEVA